MITIYCEGQANCPGHAMTDKIGSCVHDAIWAVTLNGFAETTGNVESPGGHTSIVTVTADDTAAETTDGRTVTLKTGAYLVNENDRGFVEVTHYADSAEARKFFDVAASLYSVWMGDDE